MKPTSVDNQGAPAEDSSPVSSPGETALIFDNAFMNVCNMACAYCRPDISARRQRSLRSRSHLEQLSRELRRISSDVAAELAPPVLKMSGAGEVFLLPDLVELVDELSRCYRHLQLSTNGVLVERTTLAALAALPVSLAVSLDGHTPAMNECRSLGAGGVTAVTRTVREALDAGIGVEIFATLTAKNVGGLVEFAAYVHRELPGARLLPFPVRGAPKLSALRLVAASEVQRLLEQYDALASALAPRVYLEQLAAFVTAGERNRPCRYLQASVAVDYQGQIVVCGCNWAKPVGNLRRARADAYQARRTLPVFREPLTRVPPPCRRCFTHFEVVSGLLDGSIELSAAEVIPWLQWQGAREWLARHRERSDD